MMGYERMKLVPAKIWAKLGSVHLYKVFNVGCYQRLECQGDRRPF